MGQYFWMKMAIECTALNMILAFSLWETTQQEMSTVCPPFLALSWMKMTHFKRDEQCQTREWEQTLDHHSAESSYLNVFGMRNEWYFQMSLVCLLRPSHQPGPIIGWVWFMEKLRHNRVMARIMRYEVHSREIILPTVSVWIRRRKEEYKQFLCVVKRWE